MTTENRLNNEPTLFTITADDPFGLDNFFGSIGGVDFNKFNIAKYDATVAPVTEQHPNDIKIAGVSYLADVDINDALTCGGAGVTYTSSCGNMYIDPYVGIIARIEKLEQQVEMWKSAAVTLADINRQLQEAAEGDRDDRLMLGEEYTAIFTENDMMPKTPSVSYTVQVVDKDTTEQDAAITAYARAMKVVK